MKERWNTSRSRKRTMELLEEQLFVDMYDALLAVSKEYGEPSPAELWDEAARRWKPLLAAKRPQLAVEMLRDELTDEYGERSSFLTLMILLYMLVAMFRPGKDSPYRPFCEALAEATFSHPLRQQVWEGIRQTEDEEERAGREIGIVSSLLTEMQSAGQTIDLDDIERYILRLPTFDLQQQALQQADNLLRGTAWSGRSAGVQEKMFALVREQQEREDRLAASVEKAANKPTTQNNIHLEVVKKKETNIDKNYGPNIEHSGGTLSLPEGTGRAALPPTGDDGQ